jgi:hypothetical protein
MSIELIAYNKSFFVSIPVVLVETMELEKEEELEWILEDNTHLLLRRYKKKKIRKIVE